MHNLDQISVLLVYSSIAALLVAMVAFALDISKRKAEVPGAEAPTRRPAANAAMMVTRLAAVFLAGAMVTRGIEQKHAPWSNMYEFTLAFTLVALVVYLGMALRRDLRDVGIFVVLPALAALGIAVVILYVRADGVAPILSHYWLIIHVPFAIGAVGMSCIAAFFAGLQLLKDFSAERGWSKAAAMVEKLPAPDALERIAYRMTTIGFVLWTFTIVAGAIWANSAWTRAWGWDPKEVWSLVIWVIYAAYLHGRTTRGWDGRRSAYLILIGFIAVLINLFVVNYFFPSLHSYA
ncbi:MAG: c-type cytochrome biogenesis protein CcsB [Bowdeniella nasicola]|nr:c-type cytochrome biogenesis protein CcsB [Bowdeniella nasicola]